MPVRLWRRGVIFSQFTNPIYLVGPTAVGKTSVALELAPRLNAEIVIADSMQVYRGLDIGTAKPSNHERQRVTHHLLDIVDPTEEFSVARFVPMAKASIQEIQSSGKCPLIVGGTGLYVKALIDGLSDGPGKDASIRHRLEGEDISVLYERLKEVDPVTSGKIDSKNKRRLIRALEVFEITGRPFSDYQNDWDKPKGDVCIIGLERNREDIIRRIEQRVDQMLDTGWVQEVQRLLARGIDRHSIVMQVIGYKEIIASLRGECTLDEAKSKIKINTRQFARRQMTWFRKDSRIQWVHIEAGVKSDVIAGRVMEVIRKTGAGELGIVN